MPQRLARLGGSRPQHRAPARPRSRAGRRRSPRSARRCAGWQVGDRVTVPFVCACGSCPPCLAGDHQVCDRQTQPGFTGWGSFAELVALDHADVNLVALPDELDAVTAAALGCRFATAFRAVVHQGRVRPGDWVAVHGCGGVGLSAVMVAVAAGARVVAVDVTPAALELAGRFGAAELVDASADGRGARGARRHRGRAARVPGRAGQPRRRPRPRCAAWPSAGGTCRWACCRLTLGAAADAHGAGDRARARDRRQPRHGGPRLPGDARAGGGRPAPPGPAGDPAARASTRAAAALAAMGEPGYPAGVTVLQPVAGERVNRPATG